MDQDELDKHIEEISTAASRINGFFNGLAIAATIVFCMVIYRKCL